MRARIRRKRWEDLAEQYIGKTGFLKIRNRSVLCTIEEIVLRSENGSPKVFVKTDHSKKVYPLKEWREYKKISGDIKDEDQSRSSISIIREQILKGKAEKLESHGPVSVYKVKTRPLSPALNVVFSERHKKVLSVSKWMPEPQDPT
jgi:hypothetical protein